jgi:ABC-type nitrate/sulfonate/bicarbonate transport system substrate-binding protein
MTKKTLFAILAALIPVLLSACDKTPQPPLVFGANAWPGYEPVYLARELGYLQGANLRLDAYGTGAEVEQAFQKHAVHVAALPLDRALLLRQDIPDLKIILLFDAQAAAASPPGKGLEAGKGAPAGKAPETGRKMDVLVTRDEDIGQYHHEMQQLLQGWRRALDYMHASPDQAVQIMAQREHLTPAQFNLALQGIELYGWQRNQQLMIGEPPPVGAAFEAAQRALLAEGKLNMGVDTSMLLEPTLLAEPEK